MSEILMRIMGIAERARTMAELSMAGTVVFGILLVFGVINCLLGYRLLRFWMMLGGFFLGAGAGFAGAYTMGLSDKMQYLMVMVIAGILLAVVAFLIYRVGIFVLGAAIGLFLSIYILHPTTSAVFFVCILAGVGLGTLAMRYAKEVIIVGTSLIGGVMAGLSLARLGGMKEFPIGILMSVGFALLGILIQFVTNKDSDEDDEDEEEEEEELETDASLLEDDDDFYAYWEEEKTDSEVKRHGKRSKN